MKKLTDYSREFLPDLKLEDFSRDTLVDLIKIYSRLYQGLDGFWYLSIKEKDGNDVALALDMATWHRASRYEMVRLTKQFNIKGNDVVALMKGIQLSPWYWTMQAQIDIESPRRAIMTITHCPTLDALEKEGAGRENQICTVVEPVIYKDYAAFFNPDIKVNCLKAPPRKSQDEISCQWEFRLD